MTNTYKHANIEITKACNLSCNYCFNDSGRRQKGELNLDEWISILNTLSKQETQSVLITGGEPMMYKHISEVLDHSLTLGFDTSILINGFNINKLPETILKELKRVQLSIDSIDNKYHDRNRGEGSHTKAMEAFVYLFDRGIPIEISSTISSGNENHLNGIYTLAVETGSKVIVRPLQKIGRATQLQHDSLDQTIEEQKEKLIVKHGVNCFVSDFANYVPVLGKEHDEIMVKKGNITILPDGKLRGLESSIFSLQ